VNDLAAIPARELAPSEICRKCDPEQFRFNTTEELEDVPLVRAQPRAVNAITFGVGIGSDGYNLYAMGPEGLGRHTLVRRQLERQAAERGTPADWCYVFNFESPHEPRALQLPAGQAARLRDELGRLAEDLRTSLPAAFETDEYRTRLQEIEAEFSERQDKAIGAVGERAKEQQIALVRTPAGFGFVPRRGEEVMTPDEFHKLPEEDQKRIEQTITALQQELEGALRDVPKWRREAQRKLHELNRQVARAAVRGLIDELKAQYRALTQVVSHLAAVEEDMVEHADAFRQPREGEAPTLFGVPLPAAEGGEQFLRRYRVNVLMSHIPGSGAPIVYEDNPAHDNLVGRIEHVAQMGAFLADFTLIKAGALHRANGGYLILDAAKVLYQPFAWEALKRALRSREIRTAERVRANTETVLAGVKPGVLPRQAAERFATDRVRQAMSCRRYSIM